MTKTLAGRRVAVLAADGVAQAELAGPRQAVEDAGATTELLSIKEGQVQAVGPATEVAVDKLVGDASPDDYDALILGGPDGLRGDEGAAGFIRSFVDSGKPVGMICHGPLTLVEAGVVRGRTLTSYPENRHDLPAFCREIVTEFAAG
jgi:deglycase